MLVRAKVGGAITYPVKLLHVQLRRHEGIEERNVEARHDEHARQVARRLADKVRQVLEPAVLPYWLERL